MSHETRFWTVLGLIASIIGVYFAYRQVRLAEHPTPVAPIPAPQKPSAPETGVAHKRIDHFLSREKARYAVTGLEGSNLELIEFIDTASIHGLPNGHLGADVTTVRNGSIYTDNKYTISSQDYDCEKRVSQSMSERDYGEDRKLRSSFGPSPLLSLNWPEIGNPDIDFVCMSEPQRDAVPVSERYWWYLPKGDDPVTVADRMFEAMGTRSGH